MLSREHRLFFPKLQKIEDCELRHNNGNLRLVRGYKLDWSWQEAMIEKKHEDWKAEHHKDKDLPFVGQVPGNWNAWMRGLVFAVDHNYLAEIKHFSELAFQEWNRHRSFDTVIRDKCLRPSKGMVFCAFTLLGDCVYDPEKKWFSRGCESAVFCHLATYKFWAYQTGRGLLWEDARMYELERYIKHHEDLIIKKSKHTLLYSADLVTLGRQLLTDIDEHQKKFEDSYKELIIQSGPKAHVKVEGHDFTHKE